MLRNYGEEQPYIPLKIFKIRLPFLHYKWEHPEAFQAIFMSATCLGAIPILTENLGISFEIAWSLVIINGILYNLHSFLGDPVVPGWITPSIPLTILYLNKFSFGNERFLALIAVQFLVAIIFLIMGISGLSEKLIKTIPIPLKSGILLGAGFASIVGEFQNGGRIDLYPASILSGALVCFYILFSQKFKSHKHKNRIIEFFGKYGMLPAIILSLLVGILVGELPQPKFDFSQIVKIPNLKIIYNHASIFGLGIPDIHYFFEGIPIAILIYIIAVGDIVTSEILISEADIHRKDEKIDFDSNRSNIISGVRNLFQCIFGAYIPMSGPLSAAVTASVAERYKDNSMGSIFGGVGTFRIMTFFSVMIVPIVSLIQPVLPVALSLVLLIQGYVCTKIGMKMCRNEFEMGIAGIMGGVLITKGAFWGICVGFLMLFIILEKE